ncbi:MAG: hypothetical protein UU77_C0013G0011 [candidate division WWE3 bacterium GW2011_GWC1_41_7]|uniref:Uncharacterized protein n=4 Tax=Katanobacteria TaxID=422282 RepID=A0A0G0XBV9_UNCKA|nr:MAG: hypothetical protein UU72_C0019G0011 [candidate division WWE3 bacterium GW2011_GWB1_41_6]KKS20896.1 MAG: hypothetical protein UU77_C0013G0011 [candidate division WWE3 bacterium GW2011_GWC1_41_7]KKS21877.1 MAG: hypothetical protein UU80_C0018G0013 [candidate division WWE3 bacterium GW2011_GWA1_41_8]OGC57905.1 MAG: hypothetical protein A2976_00340 [candidate division WWE3 bacterium RIFCSPLOWO2_01_FULL_41_9]
MSDVRLFSLEDTEKVRKFIIDFLKKYPMSTEEEIRKAAQGEFPNIDCVSAIYHLLKDLLEEGALHLRNRTVYSLH